MRGLTLSAALGAALLSGCCACGRGPAESLVAKERAVPESIARHEPGAGARVTFSVEEADLRHVLRLIAWQSGKNIVLEPMAAGKITLEVRDLPWREALDLVLERSGCDVQQIGGQMLYIIQPIRVSIQTGC